MKLKAIGVALLLALVLSACSLPRVYRLSVQQGNVITQEMVDSLKPGMTREQVAFVMGEPVIRNPFDDSRWDYVYTFRVPGYVDDQSMLSLYFVDGKLSHFAGDFKPSEADDASGEGDVGDETADADEAAGQPDNDAA